MVQEYVGIAKDEPSELFEADQRYDWRDMRRMEALVDLYIALTTY